MYSFAEDVASAPDFGEVMRRTNFRLVRVILAALASTRPAFGKDSSDVGFLDGRDDCLGDRAVGLRQDVEGCELTLDR